MFIGDDTMLEHPGSKVMEYVGWFFDHASGNNVLAHQPVTSGLYNLETGIFYPFLTRLYVKRPQSEKEFKTKYGEIKELSVPRNRDNKFHSAVIDENKSIGLEELITSMYSNGVSTRMISTILKDIFNNRYSPSSISRITDMTLEEVNKFVNRKLDKRYIVVMLDGLFFYLRRETVDKESVIFALGIKESGKYEKLGFYLTVKEYVQMQQ